MVKHTQTIRQLVPTNCLSVFNHFVGLALKELKNSYITFLLWTIKESNIPLPFYCIPPFAKPHFYIKCDIRYYCFFFEDLISFLDRGWDRIPLWSCKVFFAKTSILDLWLDSECAFWQWENWSLQFLCKTWHKFPCNFTWQSFMENSLCVTVYYIPRSARDVFFSLYCSFYKKDVIICLSINVLMSMHQKYETTLFENTWNWIVFMWKLLNNRSWINVAY